MAGDLRTSNSNQRTQLLTRNNPQEKYIYRAYSEMRYISAADDKKKEISKTNMSQYIIVMIQLPEMRARIHEGRWKSAQHVEISLSLRYSFEGL
jgi:hypothetical protein